MSDTFAPTADAVELPGDADRRLFYVVSKRKFSILFLGTLGLYAIYWFYKNWDQFKDNVPYASEFGTTIWPVPRAIFSIFFIHSLFRKIKEAAADNLLVQQWSNTAHAWWLVVLLVADNVLDRMSAHSIGSPVTDLLSLLILVPLLLAFLKAQAMINITCGDDAGAANNKLTGANWAWLVFGLVLWLGALYGLMPTEHASASYSSSSSW